MQHPARTKPSNLESPVVHLRVHGRSTDVPLDWLQVGPNPHPTQLKEAVARYLEIAPGDIAAYAVDTRPGGNLVVRPQAVFG